jgi:hypothetical protein
VIGGSTRLVALLGQPVAGSLSPRMQNAAFAARALDWAYLACEVAPEGLAAAVGGLVALGFGGANVTAPHKEAAAELCDEAEGPAVNTLVVRDGRVLGFNTDKAIVADIEADRVCLIGAGGAAKALLPALHGEVRMFSRGRVWPPEASGAEQSGDGKAGRDELRFQRRADLGAGGVRAIRQRGGGTPDAAPRRRAHARRISRRAGRDRGL